MFKLAKNLIKQDYKKDLQSNWNKIKMDEKFFTKYYSRILDEGRHYIENDNLPFKLKRPLGPVPAKIYNGQATSDLLDTLYTLKEDVSELGIQSPLLIGQEMKILQVLGLYDKMWELYRTSPMISVEGYNAILEYYLTLAINNNQQVDENHEFNLQHPSAVPTARPATITKRKIWQVVTALKTNSEKPNMKTYCLLLHLFSFFYQDKKTCVDIMNKMSASGLDYSRESILTGIAAMARCDMDPSPRLDKLLYKYSDTLKLELGKDVDMIKALIQYWVVRKKPHACFKVFQKAAKCHTRLDVEGIELILEAARLTEEPCQLTVGSVVPYLEAIQSNGTNARDPTEPSSKKLNLDLEWIEVIKFLSETGFPNPNNYGDGVTDEQITLAKASAQRILDISKNVSQLPSSINQIVFYAKGALQLTPGKTRAEDRKFLLESFMHGWMDTRGDINEMEKAVLVVEAV